MSIKTLFVKLRDGYVINQVQELNIGAFKPDIIRRYRVIFSGRVQKVGFRLEVCELAKRLDLVGFCKNLENGDVLAELQGPDNKIKFLISFLESLKRIKIRNKIVEEIQIKNDETTFMKL